MTWMVYGRGWQFLGRINSPDISSARAIALKNYPDYRFITLTQGSKALFNSPVVIPD